MHMICCFGKNKFSIESTRFPKLGNIQCETVDIEIQKRGTYPFWDKSFTFVKT